MTCLARSPLFRRGSRVSCLEPRRATSVPKLLRFSASQQSPLSRLSPKRLISIRRASLSVSAGLPRPEIEDIGGCVTVRFRPTRYVPPQRVARNLTERQRQILALLATSKEGLALREILARLEGTPAQWEVKEDLAFLKQLELVRSLGRGRGAHWSLGNQ